MMRERCGNCASGELEPVLDLGTSPVANTYPTSPDAELRRYPLGLVRCQHCDLVQISEIVPDHILWEDYTFYSSASWVLHAHHQDYAAWLWAEYPDLMEAGPLVEIGCNDGSLLQHLVSPKRPTIGVDPAAGPTQAARDSEWAHRSEVAIFPQAFGVVTAADLYGTYGRAKVIVANNVAAHIADLDDFIGGIRTLLHPDGVAIAEVQYLPDLLLGNDVTMVYHEHRYFYSLTTLWDMLSRRGLVVTQAWHNDVQGGTVRVEVRHHRKGHTILPVDTASSLHAAERWLNRYGIGDLQGRTDRVKGRLLDLLDVEREQRRVVVGYGASAKAVTLANWCGLTDDLVAAWLDTTPAKIGRYLPGTIIPIIECDDDRADTYLLTVVNYLSGVLRQEAAWLADPNHRMILPIPVPRIL